jgi:tetratricopeptide (TPR) repeat protein
VPESVSTSRKQSPAAFQPGSHLSIFAVASSIPDVFPAPRMKLLLAILIVAAQLAVGVETKREANVEDAIAQAEKLIAAERWSEALEAGNRLRTLVREHHGEEHPDSALAELFLGEVRDHLGDGVLAEAHFRRALAIQEKVLPEAAPERITTLSRLAARLKNRQAYDEAAGLLQRALDLQMKVSGPEKAETAVALTNLARVLRSKREYDRAGELLERALAIERRTFGGTAPGTIDGLRELAQVRDLAGESSAAELATAERVVAVEARFGSSPEFVAALSDWGRCAEQQQHFTDAEPRYRRALDLAETVFAEDEVALAGSLTQLGWCLRNLERYDEAQPLLQRALDCRLRALDPNHPDVAWSYRNLGWILRLKREFEAARPLFEKALAIREQTLGAADPLTLASLAELGDLAWLRGSYDEAASLLEQRRYRLEESTGPASEATAAAWHGLAIVYESAKRWPEATQAALRSLRLTEQRLGPADAQTLGEMLLLSRICQSAGALAPALAQYARLVAWFHKHPEADGKSRAELLRQYAIATLRSGKADDAAPLFRESRRVHETAFGTSDAATLRSIADLWAFYDETRQPALALDAARELAARTEAVRGSDAVETATVFDRLGQLCISLGDNREAAKAFRRSLEARRRHGGEGSVETLGALAQTAARFEGVRDFGTAASFRTERLGAVERKFGHESEEAAAACGDLGFCYFRQHDLASARGMFERQFTLLEKRGGAETAAALSAVARLGDVAVAARDWVLAMKTRERLAAGCARFFGSDHPETGRALLLLGEALLATGAEARADAALRDASRILSAHGARAEGISTRIACALARSALRQRNLAEAKQRTRDALAGSIAGEESLAEAFSLLGDEWSRAGDEILTESTLTAALLILTQTAGDQDENTLALLQRLAVLRLRLGRTGAGELLDRALAASEALNGAETMPTADVLGWLALARVNEKDYAKADAAIRRRREILRKLGRDDEIPAHLDAWTAWLANPRFSGPAWDGFSSSMLDRWRWAEPVAAAAMQSLAEARALAVP